MIQVHILSDFREKPSSARKGLGESGSTDVGLGYIGYVGSLRLHRN